MITRREAIKQTALATTAVATAIAGVSSGSAQAPAGEPTARFILPPLGYPFDALEPYIDAQTMQIHHDKHHAAYIANLNKAVAGQTELAGKTVEDLVRNLNAVPESVRMAVRNNGGGHYNHTLFWQMLKKDRGGRPDKGDFREALKDKFGKFEDFQQQFSDAAMKVFGSGWAWLVLDGKTLKVESAPNQDTPLSQGRIPLLGIDVWEHAYYLKYQNRRVDYVASFWNAINWDFVAERYTKFAA
jgi:superoxide dismutase, Fe-Mn family